MLEVKGLSAFYDRKRILSDINLSLEKGRLYALIGRNGSGKSTLLACLSSQLGYEGEILLDGENPRSLSHIERAKRISLLPQTVKAAPFTVYDLCSFGRNPYGDIASGGAKYVSYALEKAGIAHLSGKRTDELSGGERQLSYFAMNLCQDANLMLLDEPTANLDMEHEHMLLSCAKELCAEGKTAVCAMHNLSLAVKYSDGIIILDGGRCVFSGATNECLEAFAIEKHFGVKKFTSGCEIFFSM